MVEEVNELHLLLIEDNAGDADLFREYLDDLRGKRFRSSHVTELGQALAYLSQHDIDIIILDLMLPDSTGIPSLERMHRAAPRTPIVVLSGLADEELGQRAIQMGAQDFLHKNALDSDTLARSLRYATERFRLQNQFRSLVENNADAIVVVSRDGIVTFINKAAEALFGRPRSELVGEPFGFPIEGNEPADIELRRPDEEVRAAEMRVAPIQWEGESAWLASIRDVTDRKHAEELQRRLYHADRLASIGQLASGVAHEINNPSSFIRTNLETLREHHAVVENALQQMQRHPSSSTELGAMMAELKLDVLMLEIGQMLADNLTGIERISKIVKALGSFSRIERDEVEPVDLNEVLEAACTMTFNEIRHRATLRKDLGDLPQIAADRGKLTQVFTNLLINAAHALDPGAADRNYIRVATRREGDEIIACIEDTGNGMDEAHIAQIFTPFFTTKKRGLGTGLGLSLSADIIRKHSGHVRVSSVPGQGTCFEVVLPVETGMTLPKPTPPKPAARPPSQSRARVLVVDDEPMLLEALFRMLRRSHQVILAEGGTDALSKLEQSPAFDVVICDLMMPEIDGIKLYHMVGERWPGLQERIVFCSGGAFAPEAKEFIATVSKRNVVLEKPIKQDTLLHAVSRVIEMHGLLREPPAQA